MGSSKDIPAPAPAPTKNDVDKSESESESEGESVEELDLVSNSGYSEIVKDAARDLIEISTRLKEEAGETETVEKSDFDRNPELRDLLDALRHGRIKDGKVSSTTNGRSEDIYSKKSNGNVEGQENGKKLDDGDNGFRVGDFVWTKIKSHPWWPGQIHDPIKASEFALKYRQEDRLLVAFFGDGSCSWSLPSELVPFVENFKHMSMDSSSKSFHKAIQMAAEEIGRLMEVNMACKCIPLEKRDGLARKVVDNVGVKVGALAPEVDIRQLSIPEYGPAEIVAKVLNFAKDVYFDSVLEIAVLRSWLSAFYNVKGGYRLNVFCEPGYIEGLEDNNKNINAMADDSSVPIETPIVGPPYDDWVFSSGVNSANPKASSDEMRHRRKEKSVAELMEKNNDVNTKSQGSRKRKDRVSETPDEKISNAKNSGIGAVDGVNAVEKTDEIEAASVGNTSDGGRVESELVTSSRERKKSKYLSPPYANPSSKMELKSDKITRKNRVKNKTEASGDLSASSPVINSVDKASDGKLASRRVKEMNFLVSEVDVPVNELLSEMQFAALDPLYLSKKGSLDKVWAFVSALRSSTYAYGSDFNIYKKCKTGKKRKSLASPLGIQENDLAKKKSRSVKTEQKPDTSKPKEAADFCNVSKSGGDAWSSLVLTFTSEFPLPSQEEIVRLFGKFGSLNENETIVATNSHSVRIVYMNDSDTEEAFRSSVADSPFGTVNVKYWLQRCCSNHKQAWEKPGSSSQPTDDFMSDVGVIRQKLETMTAILEVYHSEFSAEDKSSLKNEMKNLMENVETVSEKVRNITGNTSS